MVGCFFCKTWIKGSNPHNASLPFIILYFFKTKSHIPHRKLTNLMSWLSSINSPHRPQLIKECNLLNGLPGEGKIVGPDKAQKYFGQPSSVTGSQKAGRFVRFDGSTDGSSGSKPIWSPFRLKGWTGLDQCLVNGWIGQSGPIFKTLTLAQHTLTFYVF